MTAAVCTPATDAAVDEFLRLARHVREAVEGDNAALLAHGDQLRAAERTIPLPIKQRMAKQAVVQLMHAFLLLDFDDPAVVRRSVREFFDIPGATS